MKRLSVVGAIIVMVAGMVFAQDYPILIGSCIQKHQPEQSNLEAILGWGNIIDVREIDVDINSLLNEEVVSLILDGETITVEKTNSISRESEDYIYCSYKSVSATVSISKLRNNIQGLVHASSGTYVIETIGEDSYVLVKINTDDAPLEAEPEEPDDNEFVTVASQLSEANANPGEISYIRVLVLYTPEALSQSSDITNTVYNEINRGNESLINSNVNARLEVVYIGQTASSESSYTFEELLQFFHQNGDGFADEVHSLRSRFSADVCVLLVDNDTYCGYGRVHATPSTAFSVVCVHSGCSQKYSFTHEIGHNLGCRHDTISSPRDSPYRYGHGYVHYTGDSETSWRTMMAYNDICTLGCHRILYWSNPDIEYEGHPTGTTSRCNNARVWAENAPIVSSFYSEPNHLSISYSDNYYVVDYACWRARTSIAAGSGYIVNSGQTIEMLSPTSVVLLAKTTIKSGSRFRAAIEQPSPSVTYPRFLPSRDETSKLDDLRPDILVRTVSNELQVAITLPRDCENVNVYVYDISGNLLKVFERSARMQEGENRLSYNIEDFPNGVYLLSVQTPNQNYIRKFFK